VAGEVEAQHASEWYSSQLLGDAEQKASFAARLQELIVEHNRGHWYVDEPHRGCAYRALTSTTNACDPMLLRAAEAAGVKDLLTTFCKQFSDVGEVIMWINPGEVKVLLGKAQKIIYSDGTGSDNPYEKMRIKIVPTRLAVKVDMGDMDRDAPGSPASSGGGGPSCGGSVGGSEGFGYQWQGQASQGMASSGSVTPRDGASPTESPAQSWRVPAGCPPPMVPLPAQQSYGMFQPQQGDMGPLDGNVMLSGGMGAMGGIGNRPEMQMQHGGPPGASPMRGAAFAQMNNGGCSNSAVIF